MNYESEIKKTRLFLKELSTTIKRNGQGQYSWEMNSDILIDNILSYDKKHTSLTASDKIHFFRNAYISALEDKECKTQEATYKKAFHNYEKACAKILMNKQKFKIITSVSMTLKSGILKSRTINECNLKFYNELPKAAKRKRDVVFDNTKEYKNLYEKEEVPQHTYVVITVDAHNEQAAITKALNVLSVYRALVQLSLVKSISFLAWKHEDRYPSSSKIKTGRFHTLHSVDFKPNEKSAFWYEKEYEPSTTRQIDVKPLDDLLDTFLKRYRNSNIQEHIKKSLILYIEALDINDGEFRFTKLWSVFEVLLSADNTSELSKRISSFYIDKELIVEKMKASREVRNRAMHAGINGNDYSIKCFELMNVFENCIKLYLSNPFRFKTVSDFNDFVSSPRQLEDIDSRIKTLQIAKKYCNFS